MKSFLTKNNIPFHYIWFFLSDIDGKKVPIGEYNQRSIEDIKKLLSKQHEHDTCPMEYKKKDNIVKLSKNEIDSVERAYSIFLKHTENIYCIDIDDENITSMNDLIEVSEDFDIFKNSPWIKGNNKGIHIYIKLNNMIEYTNEKKVFNDIEGDLIHKTNNMWEKVDKKMNGSNLEIFEYEDIKHLFNDTLNQTEKKRKIKNEPITNTETNGEIKKYIELGLKHEIFEKMTSGNTKESWYILGVLIKNEMKEQGENLFVDLSRHHPKFNENNVRTIYKLLGNEINPKTKKQLSLNTLTSLYKKTDVTIYKKIIKDTIIKQINTVEFDTNKLIKFDSIYFNSFKDNYTTQKEYFEKFVCKVMRPEPQFIWTEGQRDFGKKACIFSEGQIITAFKHLKTEIFDEDEEKDKSFISLWLNDENQRVHNQIEFIPKNETIIENNDKEIYNLFTGYSPKIKSNYTKENSDKILKYFHELGTALCGDNENHYNFLIKFLAHMIQKPNEKIGLAFIIKGKQGTGKNVFLNAIGNIIGKEHYITSSNPKDFFGDYAEGFYHKLLVNMNECEGKDTFDFEGKMKSFITEETITINPKKVRPIEIQNLARLMIFTNKPNPIKIDVNSKDRRYCVFETSDKFLDKKYGTKFWSGLIDHFNKPEFIACLYDYLNNTDITNWKWKEERPITEAYKVMCKLFTPVEALFFEYFIEVLKPKILDDDNNLIEEDEWTTEIIKSNKEVYDEYIKFCKSNGFTNEKTYQPSISKFNNKITELNIPHKLVKSQGHTTFRYTPKEIYDYILFREWINRDVNDPHVVIVDEKGEEFIFET